MIYDSENFPDLPDAWAKLTVNELFDAVSNANKKLKTKEALEQGKYPVIDQGAKTYAGFSNDEDLVIDASKKNPIILFGDHTRVLKYIDKKFVPGADGTKLLRPTLALDYRFAFAMLRTIKLPDRGYSRHFQFLRDSHIPLAPLAEQKRIADKLDALLARVDATRERLDRIPTLLKRFRQSVLADATSGRLTEDWRQSTGSFMAEQSEDWQWPPIPDSWKTVSYVDVVDSRLGKMLDKVKNSGVATKYLGNINVRWFRFDLTELQDILISEKERQELCLKVGDVLICEGGEPGRCAIWTEETKSPITFQKALHRARVSESILPQWLAFNLKHDCERKVIDQIFTGTTIKHLTGKALNDYPLRLPPLSEQTEIVRRVEALFALADKVEARYTTARAQVDKLTPALLAKAFRGELVDQDPNDEPAEQLLARLRATRESEPVKRRGRKAK